MIIYEFIYYSLAVFTRPGEKSYVNISVADINVNKIITNALTIKPNFIFLCKATITINEIQWYCISLAKNQVWTAH
jgi:hypothetical protein